MKKYIACLICYLYSFFCLCQEANTAKEKVSQETKSSELSDLKKSIEELKSIVSNGKDSKTVVGTISLRSKNINLQSSTDTSKINVDVDSVCLFIKDGIIINIDVFARIKKDKVINPIIIINQDAPITVGTRINTEEKLSIKINNTNYYVFIGKLLHFRLNRSQYVCDDANLVLQDLKEKSLVRQNGVNSLLDLKIYSDALGAFGNTSNGLILTDASFKQIIHRDNVMNKGLYWFNQFKVNVNITKFDSKFGYTSFSNFSRGKLYQRAWFNGDILFTVLNSWLKKRTNNFFYIDLGMGVGQSNFVNTQKDSITVNLINYILETGVKFAVDDNIGTSLSLRSTLQLSPQTDFDSNSRGFLFLRPSFDIFWHPKDNKSSRIFSRINYVINVFDPNTSYINFQLGYSVLLSKILGK